MGGDRKFPISEILPFAERFRNALEPHTTFCEIAGSIRRQSSMVGDIELVLQPKMVQEAGGNTLFGNSGKLVRDPMLINGIKTMGDIQSGNPETGRTIILKAGDIQVDVFIPQPHDLIRVFVIRTGSSEYAFKKIATAWKTLGWVGTEDGLRRQEECLGTKSGEKTIWKCQVKSPTLPPHWRDEQEFFEWLKIPYVEPNQRNL